MKVLMDGRNHGAGTSGSGVCSINEAFCWNKYCTCFGALVCITDFCKWNINIKSNGHVTKSDIK